jgi:hypothetical protein
MEELNAGDQLAIDFVSMYSRLRVWKSYKQVVDDVQERV